jgi:hypothetical protein
MKKLYRVALIAGLSIGQNILSSEEKPISLESRYQKQMQYLMPARCKQKCLDNKECMESCFDAYSKQLNSYTTIQAIKDCIDKETFNNKFTFFENEFTFVDFDQDPEELIEKLLKDYAEAFNLVSNNILLKECVKKRIR